MSIATATIRLALALGEHADPEVVQAALFAEPGVEVVEVAPTYLGTLRQLGEQPHDALLVACADEATEALGLVEEAREDQPDRPIVVLHQGGPAGFMTRALLAGADDVVSGAVTFGSHPDGRTGRDLAVAFEKAIARRRAQSSTASRSTMQGRMIVTVGPKGGTGKTLVTCNLAAALAARGQQVVVVDLDLQFGDVGLSLGLRPERTIYDLAIAPGSLDSEKISDFLTTHSTNLQVLLAPRQPDHAGSVTVPFLRELFPVLRQMSDVVIVDTPPGFTPEVIAAIDCSSDACMVAMLDAPSLKNSKLGLETLGLMEYDPERIKVVLNRADSRVGVTPEDVTELLGRAPDVLVPSHRAITRSVNEGAPVAMSHAHGDARKSFETLAKLYLDEAGDPVPVMRLAPAPKRGLFGRMAPKAG